MFVGSEHTQGHSHLFFICFLFIVQYALMHIRFPEFEIQIADLLFQIFILRLVLCAENMAEHGRNAYTYTCKHPTALVCASKVLTFRRFHRGFELVLYHSLEKSSQLDPESPRNSGLWAIR